MVIYKVIYLIQQLCSTKHTLNKQQTAQAEVTIIHNKIWVILYNPVTGQFL